MATASEEAMPLVPSLSIQRQAASIAMLSLDNVVSEWTVDYYGGNDRIRNAGSCAVTMVMVSLIQPADSISG
ncbi:hypothetical protein Nepgr_001388 [Nepenthes gracilis]|uniref:Uncharacterized protein n=1 Tax=Nepenthes gracilis TaxID=150966 RepID=A0AAD3P4B4_NEPGR|nr:hypothetical protein Nepgr_001388 [Nepenthes gracilis]